MTTAILTRGSSFGDIKLTHTLGSGGFSDVYLGTDTRGRKLAVKVLRLSKELLEGQSERVNRERDVLARIDSRGVAKLVKSDLTGEHPWIASEFIEGLTLRESIARDGAMALDETLGLVRRVAEILDELHSAGIAHRDLTPNNIVIGDDGPVIIDFGSARVDLENTATGSVLLAGTQAYAAPETIKGEPTGRSGDIFALARIAQFCVSGNDEGTPQLPSAIQAGLQDDPEQRPSAQEVAQALTDFAGPTNRFQIGKKVKLPRRVRIRTLVAASLLATAVAAGATSWWVTRERPVRTLAEDESGLFSPSTFQEAERAPLGSPYILDPVIPAGMEVRREEASFARSDFPWLSSRTLEVISVDSEEQPYSPPLFPLLVSAEPAPLWLRTEFETYPRDYQVESKQLGNLRELLLLDLADTAWQNCDIPTPSHGSFVKDLDLIILGGSTWCENYGEKGHYRHVYLAYQGTTEILYRLAGLPKSIDRSSALSIFSSAIPDPKDSKPKVLRIDRDETLENALEQVGYSSSTLWTDGIIPYFGRVAVALPARSSITVVAPKQVDVWALTDDESMLFGDAATVPVGSYVTQSSGQVPWFENTTGIDLILILDLEWDTEQPPLLFIGRGKDTESTRPDSLLDQVFEGFDSRDTYVGGSLVDEQFINEILAGRRSEESDSIAARMNLGFVWDILLPIRDGSYEPEDMSAVEFGNVVLPLPPDLEIVTESLGEVVYAARANPFGQRAEILRPTPGTHLLLRNSTVVLPGASGSVVVPELNERSQCRRYETGTKTVGVFTFELSVESHCISEPENRSLISNDQIERLTPFITLTVSRPRGLMPWDEAKGPIELFAAEMHASYRNDFDYFSVLLIALELALNDMSVEEAEEQFGIPDRDVGVLPSYLDWLLEGLEGELPADIAADPRVAE